MANGVISGAQDANQTMLTQPGAQTVGVGVAPPPQPGDQQPTGQPPTAQPIDQPPTDQQPTDQQPTDQQPTDQQPTDQQPTAADGVTTYVADLLAVNGSGVEGAARAMVDEQEQTLTIEVQATGLEPNQVHPMHIHGRFADPQDTGAGAGADGDEGTGDGPTAPGAAPGTDADSRQPLDSVVPNLLVDIDDDGFIELAEGRITGGEVILPLTETQDGASPGGASPDDGGNGGLDDAPAAAPGSFPEVDDDGSLMFSATYDLGDSEAFAEGFGVDDLLPLTLRVIELHGLSVDEGVGADTPGEVDGTGGYKPLLPVAFGEFREEGETGPLTASTVGGGMGDTASVDWMMATG